MNARRAPACALAALLTVTALSGLGWAAEHACPAPTVDADPTAVARFPDLLDMVRARLANRPELDACAQIELAAVDAGGIRVSVVLPDGRSTTRTAAQHDDVLPTLEALLLLPERAPALPSPTPATAPRARSPLARLTPVRSARSERDAPAPTLEPRSFGLELSLLGGPRMGEGQLAVGLGALSLLEAHGWLFGFTSRVDRYQTPLSDPEMALELGVLGGKRLHFRDFALSFVAGPAVAMKGLAFSETESVRVDSQAPPPPPRLPEDPSTGPVPRLLVGAHAGFTPRSVLRSFLGLEASIGPARVDDSPNAGSARFPVFTLGMVLGATVGTK